MKPCTGVTEYSNGEPAHSWEVAEAEGPTSKSVCRSCQAEKTEKNSIETPTTLSKQFGSKADKPRPMNDF